MTTAASLLELRCPKCGRFLGEVTPPSRVVCCGLEYIVRPNERRPEPEQRVVKG